MAVFVSLVAFGANRLGLWDTTLTKDTAIWFIGTAFVLLLNIQRVGDSGFFRRTARLALAATIFIGFFLNLFVLSFALELILVPFITLLALLSLVAGREERFASVKSFVDSLLGILGVGLICYVAWRVVTDWDSIDKAESVRQLVLPIWLTLAILPYVFLVGLWAVYGLAFMRINFQTEGRSSRRRAKLALVSVLHLRAHAVAAFAAVWPRRLATSERYADARAVMKEYRAGLRYSAAQRRREWVIGEHAHDDACPPHDADGTDGCSPGGELRARSQ